MKKKLLILITILNVIVLNAQFNTGYKDGYEEGYCYEKGIGCIKPIPPIPPIPRVNENTNSYTDGYNRGFSDALLKSKNQNNNYERNRYKTAKPEFIDDFIYKPPWEMADRAMALKQQGYEKALSIINRAENNYKNGDFDQVIKDANNLIKIYPNLAIAYFFKSIAYYQKGEILNSYNSASKQYHIYNSVQNKDWYNKIYSITENYLKEQIGNSNYIQVEYFCKKVWYKNNLSNYYLGLSYYYQYKYKKAKRTFKKVKNYKPALQYIQSIKDKTHINNPYPIILN
ncbi:hypothetical protein ETU10_07560 [Apibacter muscae]|uniref:hypothetical protein n=1 Tax=Apibacter muscae TaxID=2509004 RepID=UPI0011AD7456|nr:hypothetical protein [Apibacter muscae]TWP23571.1 hypothetical protein ETU10_07560 [Apibacter muscae]